jgi:hypothetical protein
MVLWQGNRVQKVCRRLKRSDRHFTHSAPLHPRNDHSDRLNWAGRQNRGGLNGQSNLNATALGFVIVLSVPESTTKPPAVLNVTQFHREPHRLHATISYSKAISAKREEQSFVRYEKSYRKVTPPQRGYVFGVKGTQNKLGWSTRRYIENCCKTTGS